MWNQKLSHILWVHKLVGRKCLKILHYINEQTFDQTKMHPNLMLKVNAKVIIAQ